MSKFNKKETVGSALKKRPDAKLNAEGGLSFDLSDKAKLYSAVCTSLINEPKFYNTVVQSEDGKIKSLNTNDHLIVDIVQKVSKSDPEFVMKLAAYARNELNLRSVPLFLLAEASNLPELKAKPGERSLVKLYTPHIIKRADEPAEILAYHFGRFKHSAPHSLLRGLKTAFNKFDAYQLAKYDRQKSVKIKDALRLSHPIPKDKDQSAVYKKLLDGELEAPETWEVIQSTWRDKGFKSQTAAWEHIIDKIWLPEGKVYNYMAILRNLRNLLEAKVSDEHMGKVISAIRNENAVKYSRQFPYRFFSAHKMISQHKGLGPHASAIMDALEDAIDISCGNLPVFPGTTVLAADESASMDANISSKSIVTCRDVANLMTTVVHRTCESPIASVFATHFRPVNLSKRTGVLKNMESLRAENVGGGTYGYKIIEHLLNEKIKVDRIMIFTDCQLYNQSPYWYGDSKKRDDTTVSALLRKYKAQVNPNVYTYVIDLTGYGQAVFPEDEKNVCLVAGWSDKLIHFMAAYEEDSKSAIDRIDNYDVFADKPRK